MRTLLFPLLLLVSALQAASAAEPNYEREERMAAEIVDVLFEGEPVELIAGDRSFLTIFTEADEPKGTVVILHGRGYHPDWENVVSPLRVGLVEQGWNTLSIQLPVLEKSAKYFDYVDLFDLAGPRIEAALAYAHQQDAGKVVLLAHSCGSHMAQRWIKNSPDQTVTQFDAYVGIGMGATDYKQPMVEAFQLDKMPMPLLDLYGAEDFPAVLRKAPERLEMMQRAGHSLSAQVVIPKADHYYKGKGQAQLMVNAVAEWLDKL